MNGMDRIHGMGGRRSAADTKDAGSARDAWGAGGAPGAKRALGTGRPTGAKRAMGRALRLWRMLAASALLALTAPAAWAAACLDEAQWQTLQQQSEVQPALLYVWSPRMVLSAVHADQVQTVARQEGLRMVPVHDHRVPAEEVSQALQRLRQQNAAAADALAGSVPLCNEDLVQQDAYRHFPTAWVVRKGSAHPRPLVAAMPMPYWRQGIRLRMVQAGKPKAN